ncbi:MAG: hypothetical protein IJS15_00520, partial [Victivallales bacterium]|nr:hypothetical protein [Victivallales bacterium]
PDYLADPNNNAVLDQLRRREPTAEAKPAEAPKEEAPAVNQELLNKLSQDTKQAPKPQTDEEKSKEAELQEANKKANDFLSDKFSKK